MEEYDANAPDELQDVAGTPTPAADSDSDGSFVERDTTNPNVTYDRPVDQPLKEDFDDFHLKLANGAKRHLDDLLAHFPNINPEAGEAGRIWADIVRAAQWYLQRADQFQSCSLRPDSQWNQYGLDGNGNPLSAARPRFGESTGAPLTGERALMKARAVMGLGALVQIPLWHTGIWVSIKAPSDGELLELSRRMAREKAELGRLTNAAAFSNSMVYVNTILVNFILSYVYDATVADTSPQAMKSMIKITDLPTLIWGMACATWPNGYPYARACVNPSCDEVIRANLDLGKLSWTDNSQLTEWQRRHMQRRNARASAEDLKRYQEEHRIGGDLVVGEHDAKVQYTLSVPNLQQYEDSGYAWVGAITTQAEQAFGVELAGEERKQYINDQGRVSAMRQYAHWIGHMRLAGEEVSQDRETLEEIVGLMTQHREISTAFFGKVRSFIDSSTLSHIALPKHSCPKCKGVQTVPTTDETTTHPWLIPLDVGKVFFTLLDQHTNKALQRNTL